MIVGGSGGGDDTYNGGAGSDRMFIPPLSVLS